VIRTLDDARGWAAEGTALLITTVCDLEESDYDAASGLPGWTRKHVVAHLAANADALGNLVTWAASGEVTPMYASLDQRDADIERGSRLGGEKLTACLEQSAAGLERLMGQLTAAQWRAEVVTAQGRTVPATELPWMRAREVLVHTVDLDRGTTFADLPTDFLEALIIDICRKRGLDPDALPPGPLPDVAGWLASRPSSLAGAPPLGPWL
jgi:maleylpyruvate isomerase